MRPTWDYSRRHPATSGPTVCWRQSSWSPLEGIPVPLRGLIICVPLLMEGCKSTSAPGCESAGPCAASLDRDPIPVPRSVAAAPSRPVVPRWWANAQRARRDLGSGGAARAGRQPSCPPGRLCRPGCERGVIVNHESQLVCGRCRRWVQQAVGHSGFFGTISLKSTTRRAAAWGGGQPASTCTGARGHQIKHLSLIALGFLRQQRVSVRPTPISGRTAPCRRGSFSLTLRGRPPAWALTTGTGGERK